MHDALCFLEAFRPGDVLRLPSSSLNPARSREVSQSSAQALRPQPSSVALSFKFLGSKNPQHGTAPRAFRGKSASVRADCRRFQPFAEVFLKRLRIHQTSWLRKRQPQTVPFSYFEMGFVPFLHRNAPGVRGVTTGEIGPSTIRRQRFQQRLAVEDFAAETREYIQYLRNRSASRSCPSDEPHRLLAYFWKGRRQVRSDPEQLSASLSDDYHGACGPLGLQRLAIIRRSRYADAADR
jgi:hypothetical protein